MASVVALVRGYYGGIIRETGDAFSVDDEIMADPKRRPKWVKPASGGEAQAEEGEVEPAAPVAKGKGKGKAKAETVQAPEVQPFADAPAPVRANSEINDALGTTQPDWLAPGAPVAVTD